MQTKVDKIIASSENPKIANGVVVNGQTLPADFVIMGVGVAPATQFLKGSGLDIEKDGGIKVDQYLRAKSGPDTKDVYVIGACQSLKYLYTGHCSELICRQVMLLYIPSKTEMRRALSTGTSLGIMVGRSDQPYLGRSNRSSRSPSSGAPVSLLISYSLFGIDLKKSRTPEGQQLRYCGVGHKYDRVILKGSPDDLKVRTTSCSPRVFLALILTGHASLSRTT